MILQANDNEAAISRHARPIELTVNEKQHTVNVDPNTRLLYVLRNDLEINGPKYGCGLGECGACTILVDGIAARSCVIPVCGVAGRSITTLEGLCMEGGPGPVQQAFIDLQAAQCGYCTNGMIMTTHALLERIPHPTDEQICKELQYNLCRCGAHLEILCAVRAAARCKA